MGEQASITILANTSVSPILTYFVLESLDLLRVFCRHFWLDRFVVWCELLVFYFGGRLWGLFCLERGIVRYLYRNQKLLSISFMGFQSLLRMILKLRVG